MDWEDANFPEWPEMEVASVDAEDDEVVLVSPDDLAFVGRSTINGRAAIAAVAVARHFANDVNVPLGDIIHRALRERFEDLLAYG